MIVERSKRFFRDLEEAVLRQVLVRLENAPRDLARESLDYLAEYWREAEKRWVMVDAQIDDRQRQMFGIAIDTLDVKRDQFLVAGDAWRHCRAGNLDPKSFGILDMWGYWFIASNVIRDLAALNNREMLPWDVWGAMTRDDSQIEL